MEKNHFPVRFLVLMVLLAITFFVLFPKPANAYELNKVIVTIEFDDFGFVDVEELYLISLDPGEVDDFKETVKINASSWFKWTVFDKKIHFHVGEKLSDIYRTFVTNSFEESDGKILAKLKFNYSLFNRVAEKKEKDRETEWEIDETYLNLDKKITIKFPYYLSLTFSLPKKAEILKVMPEEAKILGNNIVIDGPLTTNSFLIKYRIVKDITAGFSLETLNFFGFFEGKNKFYFIFAIVMVIGLTLVFRRRISRFFENIIEKYSEIKPDYSFVEEEFER